MILDLLDLLTEDCQGPGSHDGPAVWCHAWREYLCFACKSKRTEAELRMTLADRQAVQELAAEPGILL